MHSKVHIRKRHHHQSGMDARYISLFMEALESEEGTEECTVEDEIHRNSGILYDFTLSTTGHLHKATIEHLKSVYSTLIVS